MTITQLEYIIAVDTYKSFAGGAKHCFVTQPTLSMQIKKLEEEMNILIFDRSKKPVLTTDVGKKVIEQAKIGLRELRKVPDIIRQQEDEIEGNLRVGIIPTLSPYLLPLFITKFIQDFPMVSLEIEELLSEQIAHKLNNDQLDLGLLVSPINDRNLRESTLFYEPFVVYMSTNHPLNAKVKIDLSDLNINEMWLLKEGHCFRSQSINICQEDPTENTNQLQFKSGSLETLKKIVENQFGYTLLPELAILDLDKDKQKYIKQFNGPKPMREVCLITHRAFLKKKIIDVFQASILEGVPKHLHQLGEGRLVDWS